MEPPGVVWGAECGMPSADCGMRTGIASAILTCCASLNPKSDPSPPCALTSAKNPLVLVLLLVLMLGFAGFEDEKENDDEDEAAFR